VGALVDSLRDAIADGDTKNKDEAVDNIKETLELASRRLLNSAKNGDTELDVKDLKDLASVYSLLSQTDGGNDGATGTPQAPAGIADALDDEVDIHKTPEGDKEVDQDSLINLSSDDVDKMVANTFKKQNSLNYKKVSEA
jgi:hypothetical protein